MDTITLGEPQVLQGFLGQQLGVLSRIDHDICSIAETPVRGFFARRRARRETERRRLIALDMSKQIAAGLRLLWMYLEQGHPMASGERVTRSVLRRELKAIVDTPFDHPYAVSAMWNFHAIIEQLAACDASAHPAEGIPSPPEDLR